MSKTIETLLPYLPSLMEIVVIPFVIWAAVQIGRKFGVDIQDKHKRTLQSALNTGANLAMQRKLTGATAVAVILDHVLGKGAPDAVANFKLSKDELARMAEAKLHEVAADHAVAVKGAAAFEAGKQIGTAVKAATG